MSALLRRLRRWRRPGLVAVIGVVIVVATVAIVFTQLVRSVASSPGPRYAYPSRLCSLVSSATLAEYLPGFRAPTSAPELDTLGTPQYSSCGFLVPQNLTGWYLRVYVYGPAGVDARRGFAYLVRVRSEAPRMRGFHYASRVTAVPQLGAQATAISATSGFPDTGISPSLDLLVWSGNADIEIQVADVTTGSPPQSLPGRWPTEAAALAGATAAARDILAKLPRS
jgi:hypothetical protein